MGSPFWLWSTGCGLAAATGALCVSCSRFPTFSVSLVRVRRVQVALEGLVLKAPIPWEGCRSRQMSKLFLRWAIPAGLLHDRLCSLSPLLPRKGVLRLFLYM